MTRVKLTEEALEDLQDLDGSARLLVLKAIKKLETAPEQRGAPLGSRSSGNLTTFRKLVVGKKHYRVVYRIEPDGDIVIVWVIAPRGDNEAYELALSRIRLHSEARVRAIANDLEQLWSSH